MNIERTPHNVNRLHEAEIALGSLNTRIAVALTNKVGSMTTAYIFLVLAIIGLLGITGVLSPIAALLVAWTSQTLIQLVMLPVIMISQNIQSRHAELLAEETYLDAESSKAQMVVVIRELETLKVEVETMINLLDTVCLEKEQSWLNSKPRASQEEGTHEQHTEQ